MENAPAEVLSESLPCLASHSPLWSEADAVTTLCEQVAPNSLVRLAAEGLLEKPPRVPASEEIKALIAVLARPRWQPLWSRSNRRWLTRWWTPQPDYAERTVAAWVLGVLDLPPPLREKAGDALVRTAALRHGLHPRMAWRDGVRGVLRAYVSTLPLGAVTFLLFWVLSVQYSGEWNGREVAYVAAFIAAVSGTILTPFLVFASSERSVTHRAILRAIAVRSLISCPGVKAVNAVARACFSQNATLRVAALLTIDGVLPALTEQDYGRLHALTVPRLCLILRDGVQTYLSPQIQMSLLDALAKVGDERAVSCVAHIAQAEKTSSAIRKVAEHTHAAIEQRLQQETERAILLRGSQAEDEGAETVLLRPVLETETPPEQLLRPTQR